MPGALGPFPEHLNPAAPCAHCGSQRTLQFIMAHVRSVVTVRDSPRKQISKIKYNVLALPWGKKEGKNTWYWLKYLLAIYAAMVCLGLSC